MKKTISEDQAKELQTTIIAQHNEIQLLKQMQDLKDEGYFRMQLLALLEDIANSLKK